MSVLLMHTIKHSLVYLVSCYTLLPVIWVNRFPNKEIVSTACYDHRPYLFVVSWVCISIVRSTEENRTLTCYALNKHSCELQFGERATVRVLNHVVMGEGVIANGVSLVEHILNYRDVFLHL